MNNERLCKTNPIKPNLVRCPVRRSFSEDGSLGEGGFKRGIYAALRSVVLTEDKFHGNDILNTIH